MPAIQLTLTISEDGAIHAEAPGRNGARRKLDVSNNANEQRPTTRPLSIDDIAATIRGNAYSFAEELLSQFHGEAQRKRDEATRQRKLTRETQIRNIEYVAANYPALLPTAYPGVTVRHTKAGAFFTVPRETRVAATTRAPVSTNRAEQLREAAARISL